MGIVLPYKAGSRSATALAQALQTRCVNLRNSRVHRLQRTIVNWGNSGRNLPPQGLGSNPVLNSFESVRNASCKLRTLEILSKAGVSIPEFFTSRTEAAQFLRDNPRKRIVCRTVLNGNSGNGIVIATNPDELVRANLYTVYIPKQDEYRVHVFKDQDQEYKVFDLQRKARSSNTPDQEVDWQVRNLQGGFIFMREGVNFSTVPQDVIDQATASVQALGLDFGAVDVVRNQRRNSAYVLEVNTAAGLEGTTLERYTSMIRSLLGEQPFISQIESPEEETEEETEQEPEQQSLDFDAEIPEDPVELSEPEVVQSLPDQEPSNDSIAVSGVKVYGLFVGNSLITESGLFAVEQAATDCIQESPLLRNLRQLSQISIKPLDVHP